jgi:hypothetical protein
VNTKKFGTAYIYKNQKVYKNFDDNSTNPPTTKLVELELKIGTEAKIEEKDNHLKITFVGDTVIFNSKTSNYNRPGKTYLYFPTENSKLDTISLKYLEIQSVFQGITIPFKIRPSLNDATPYQVSKAVNLGLAYGLQFTHKSYRNYYSKKGLFLNKRTNSISITPALFCGPTTVDLKASNTNNSVLVDKSVLGINSGVLLVVGVNKFNIGAAIGYDFGLGSESKDWIYQGKPWIGFVLAIDFIK